MNISAESLNELRNLLQEQLGLKYTDEETRRAGLAIMRFVLAKQRRAHYLTINNKEGANTNEITEKSG